MAISNAFVWGRGGAQLTPEQIAKQREIEESLIQRGIDTSPVGSVYEGLARVANAAAGSFRRGRLDKAESENQDWNAKARSEITGLLAGGTASAGIPANSTVPMTSAASEVAATSPVTGDTFQPFMDAIKAGGIDNPYALAAIAATGRAESGWSAENANRTWSDPSESGKPGTAGGIMSWRGPRYEALAATGDLSPQGQAAYFLKEDPGLIAKLKSAKSVEEAQQLMNNAWAFAGYNRPGGESSRRLAYAKGYLPSFQGGNGGGTEVASLDPSAGMSAADAINAAATPSGYVDPTVSAANAQPAPAPAAPEFDAGRFGPRMNLAEMPPTRADIPAQMGTQTAALTGNTSPVVAALGAPQTVSPAPSVAAAPQEVAQAQAGFPAPPAAPTARNGLVIPPAILEVLSDPRADARTRGIAELMLKQTMDMQRAAQEEQTWRARQAWTQEQQRNDPAYQLDQQYKQEQIKALERKASGEKGDEWGLNPVWGKDKDGKTVLGQVSKTGKFRPLDTGDFQPTPGVDKIDTGTQIVTRDSKTGEVIDSTPKENYKEARDKAEGGVDGKVGAEARAALAGVKNIAKQVDAQIDDILNDPNLDGAVGSIQGRLPSFTQGSVDFDKKLERLQGQAFLQARDFLKGQGQITDFESKRAEAAIAQLSTAQSEEQFKKALREFKDAVATGILKAEAAANQAPSPAGSTAPPPAPSGNKTSTGTTWKVK
ncbi:MAG: hypothetical protein PGN22_02605 [Agrobacterium cavarae]